MGKLLDNVKMAQKLTPIIQDVNQAIAPQLMAAYQAGFEEGQKSKEKDKKVKN